MKIFLIFLILSLANFTSLPALNCHNKLACWQGFYLNGQLGAGWNNENARFINANYFNTLGPEVLGNKFDFKSHNFLGGGSLGFNMQSNCWVIGVEAGALGVNLKRSNPSPFFPEIDTFASKLNWLAFTKLRGGRTYNGFLPFITGGWAGGYAHTVFKDLDEDITARSSDWINGWILGTGCDYKLTRCFSFGIGYDFVHLYYSDKKTNCPRCSSGIGFGTPRINKHLHTHIVAVRFNVHL